MSLCKSGSIVWVPKIRQVLTQVLKMQNQNSHTHM